jgi:hypothetical protein
MDASEVQARATIAAALITVHAVEIPTIPKPGSENTNAAARLRELTDIVYRAVFGDKR